MNVLKTLQHLFYDLHYLIIRQATVVRAPSLTLSHEVEHSAFHKLEYEVDIVFRSDYFFHLDYVRVAEFSQGPHFTKAHGFVPTLKLSFHLFDRNDFTTRDQLSFVYCAISPIATVLDNLEFFHLFLLQ